MNHLLSFILLLISFFFLPTLAVAHVFSLNKFHTYGPISVRSQNPLHLLFLFDPLERPEPISKGHFDFAIETNFSNLFEFMPRNTGVGLDLDMELVRTAIKIGYGVTKNNSVGIQIPFITMQGGVLDSFIQGYHKAFGFPNAGRDRVANGRFGYQVTNNGTILYQVNQEAFGLGDLVLWDKLKVFDETKWIPAIAVKGSLKIPTGRRSQGTGSGNPDFAFSVFAEKSYKRIHSYSQIGLSLLGSHPNLDPFLVNGATVFGEALEFNLTEHHSVVAQVWGNSPIFKNTGIEDLSSATFDLTVGFSGAYPIKKILRKIHYQFGFAEDALSLGPSVDFTLYFNLGVEY